MLPLSGFGFFFFLQFQKKSSAVNFQMCTQVEKIACGVALSPVPHCSCPQDLAVLPQLLLPVFGQRILKQIQDVVISAHGQQASLKGQVFLA